MSAVLLLLSVVAIGVTLLDVVAAAPRAWTAPTDGLRVELAQAAADSARGRRSTARPARCSRWSGRRAAASRRSCARSPASTRRRAGASPSAARPGSTPPRGLRRPARERSVGFVFQHYALFPHLSALDNVIQAMGHVPRGRAAGARAAATSSAPTSPGSRRAVRRSSRAASSSASRSRARSPAIRRCCCSTSRSRRSTR